MKNVDVLVIGAGAGGLTAAYTAKGFGKNVLIVDKNLPGGECTWAGCIPSKALINQANEIFTAKKYAEIHVDTEMVMQNVRTIIENVYADESIDVLKKDGIEFLMGQAKFISPKEVDVDGEKIIAKRIFICTGSSPMVPPIEGLHDIAYLTNENFFLQPRLPESMIVLGGGAIGVELSQAMNRLGIKIKLVEMAPTILPREDVELSSLLVARLVDEGVDIYTGAKAIKMSQNGTNITLHIEKEGHTQKLESEKILLALGRVPNINTLNLEAAGIAYDRRGIEVNGYMETTAKGVYAIGDVTGKYMFSHMANATGIKAVQNAILPINQKVNYEHVAWCTFTSPELATAGLTESEAREKFGDAIRVYRHDYAHIDRAKTQGNSLGLVKLICDSKGKVLGCSILGDRAGEMISEVQVIKTLGLNFAKLTRVIHPYPTYSEVLNKISKKVTVDNLLNLPIVKWFKK